ncbi:MAG: AAA family ATPase [Acidimicrobiales bacterium]|nr:AAA family ATPase [Acidimicrobiales bacterium]
MSADGELEAERLYLAAVGRVHMEHLERARAAAEMLGTEAAEATAEGIRDIVDEDAEADTAVRAAEVRNAAIRAMHAANRVRELEGKGTALAFGRFTTDAANGSTKSYVGRLSVFDGDETLLIDWRAPAAVPFYRATPLDRHGVRTRRQFHYDNHLTQDRRSRASGQTGSSGELVGYSDDVLEIDALDDPAQTLNLRGEAAVLAAVSSPTTGQMKPVVAMIQSEQDAVIRAPSNVPLIVQGGPGTGKTVVALHRAAYLLYDQREELSDRGILIVGPTRRFLRYVSNVLPSLGETGVVSATPAELFPARRGGVEVDETARLKGQPEMVGLLARAVADRCRRPKEPLRLYYGSRRVVLRLETCVEIFERAQRGSTHNDGAEIFRSGIVDALVDAVYDPAFFSLEDATSTFVESREVRSYLLAHWPTLTPEQCLNDLFGSPALLESARREAGLSRAQAKRLAAPRVRERRLVRRAWADSDIPLLDELHHRLGLRARELTESVRTTERDVEDEFELAQAMDRANTMRDANDQVVSIQRVAGTLDLGAASAELEIVSLGAEEEDAFADTAEPEADPGTLVDRFKGDRAAMVGDVDPNELVPEVVDYLFSEGVSVVELAIGDRSFRFGHVIVDEAQDLSAMQWRMVIRRAEPGSVTAVGDLAQRTIGPVEKWSDLLPAMGPVNEMELSINYRSPAEVLSPAEAVLAKYAPHLKMPRAIRHSGRPFRDIEVKSVHHDLPSLLLSSLGEDRGEDQNLRTLALIWPPGTGAAARKKVENAIDATALAESGYELLSVSSAECRGLEFDVVVVIEPSQFASVPGGLAHLFVALTRATQWSIAVSTRSTGDLFDLGDPDPD